MKKKRGKKRESARRRAGSRVELNGNSIFKHLHVNLGTNWINKPCWTLCAVSCFPLPSQFPSTPPHASLMPWKQAPFHISLIYARPNTKTSKRRPSARERDSNSVSIAPKKYLNLQARNAPWTPSMSTPPPPPPDVIGLHSAAVGFLSVFRL